MFSPEFCEFFKNVFFTEHLWTTASVDQSILSITLTIMKMNLMNLRNI